MEFLNHRDQQRTNTTNHFDLTDEAVYNFHANLLLACANSLLKHQCKKFVVDDTNKQILAPYIEEFICHLFTTKPTDKIERIDTISHFTNWIRIHLKQQGNGISQPQRPTEDEYNESF